MRQGGFEQRLRRAEIGDYAAFNVFLTVAFGVELAVLLLWSLTYLGNFSIFFNAVILCGAAGACGGIVGFLLGIPKAATLAARGDQAAANPSTGRRFENSTALEEISEWLTKIIVGLGLVEFGTIVAKVESIARRSAPLFKATQLNDDALVMITVSILLTNFLLGFSAAYIFTRMFLVSAFYRVDAANQDLLARNVDRISDVSLGAIFHDEVSAEDRKSAVDLLKVPMSSLRTAEDYLAWAKAHLIYHDYAGAAEALKRANDATSDKDTRLLSLYARTLTALQRPAEAADALGKARQAAGRNDAMVAETLADQVDGLLLSSRRTDLDTASSYLAEAAGKVGSSPRLLALRAALSARQLEGATASDQPTLRKAALEAIKALQASSDEQSQAYLDRLRRGLDGQDGLFRAMGSLATDPEVRELLPASPKPAS